jgi:uncharacterized membrane protein
MKDTVAHISHRDPGRFADKVLKASATFWFLTAAIGLWIFVIYIVGYYAVPILQGGGEVWTNTRLPGGENVYVPGDIIGNMAVVMHLAIAVIIMGFGPLQLIPQIRQRFPSFHRWNGRVYMATALATCLAGFYMIWVRKADGGNLAGDISITFDGILIILFAVIALRYALAGDIATHRRWALRLFMVVNAVWFLRIGYRLWIFLFNGPTQYFDTFFSIWRYGQYLIPLAILQLYFLTQDRAGTRGKIVMATGLFIVTIFMGIAIYASTVEGWFPNILRAVSR